MGIHACWLVPYTKYTERELAEIAIKNIESVLAKGVHTLRERVLRFYLDNFKKGDYTTSFYGKLVGWEECMIDFLPFSIYESDGKYYEESEQSLGDIVTPYRSNDEIFIKSMDEFMKFIYEGKFYSDLSNEDIISDVAIWFKDNPEGIIYFL